MIRLGLFCALSALTAALIAPPAAHAFTLENDPAKAIPWVEGKDVSLAASQRDAVSVALTSKVLGLTLAAGERTHASKARR